MTKRTWASVPTQPCTCNYLQEAADDPDRPITFDIQTAEYQFSDGRRAVIIYHCPFCGGAAPQSKRASLFAQIPGTEEERLAKLLHGIETMDDALQKLGKPDFESVAGSKSLERENEAPRIEHHRHIRYHHLSDVAEVWITERPDGMIHWHLQGKYIGDNAGSAAPRASRAKRPWWRFWRGSDT